MEKLKSFGKVLSTKDLRGFSAAVMVLEEKGFVPFLKLLQWMKFFHLTLQQLNIHKIKV
jgi:hypothetical protein